MRVETFLLVLAAIFPVVNPPFSPFSTALG
jgi:hypothetical protein